MLLNTSFAKKNFPSAGTIMICSLSESRSATILLISSGLSFKIAASLCRRSASATAVTRMRSASRLFDLLHLGGLGLQLGNPHLLGFQLCLHAHAVVLLFLQQHRLQPL